ncbi:magnesium transporter [Shewanella eurypsychrophilus]|uniref:Magnesium transporter n=1 Tax=Shewanella eurypsychrophilus TaxID=2593656 RepID=A0ABX8S2I9_9GAMM|nr:MULTISPECIES: magnesium transporter [Shewanella]QFU23235.1 magnesium transporter [Shewanella sp. YLB-09]QXP44828.1 magnesium transporter [Shewanella eurypsychrophilus]
MSINTANISNSLHESSMFNLFKQYIFQLDNEDNKNQLIDFIQEQSSAVIQRWLEILSLLQCFHIYDQLPVAEKETIFRLMPAELISDMEKIKSQGHPVIAVASTRPHLCFSGDIQVSEAIDAIQQASENFDEQVLFVVDEQGCYRFTLELNQLVKHKLSAQLADIAHWVAPCHVSTDREEAVAQLQHSEDDYLPLVDFWGKPAGLLRAKEAMSVLQQEQTQDVEMLMGIQGAHDNTPYMQTTVLEHVHKRIFWIVGLAAVGILSGMVIQSYDDAIMALTILALYMPMVADTGGNAGSQASTVIVRSMALGELKLKHWCDVLWKELRISLFIGLGLALVSFAKVFFLSQGASLPGHITVTLLGCAIALALFFQVITATVIGAALPLVATLCRQDPAVVASPTITTIVDVTGLLIYFYITSLILLS